MLGTPTDIARIHTLQSQNVKTHTLHRPWSPGCTVQEWTPNLENLLPQAVVIFHFLLLCLIYHIIINISYYKPISYQLQTEVKDLALMCTGLLEDIVPSRLIRRQPRPVVLEELCKLRQHVRNEFRQRTLTDLLAPSGALRVGHSKVRVPRRGCWRE